MGRMMILVATVLSGCAAVVQYDPDATCGDGTEVTVLTPVTGKDTLSDCPGAE